MFSFLFITFSSFQCAREPDPIVARFGDHTITLKEFRTAYLEVLKQPRMFDSKELRESFLDEMINRKLLAQEARRLNMDQNELFGLKLEAYTNKCLREAHYEQVIEPKIDIDESLIAETYRYTKEQRRIKHLFFPTPSQADSAYQMLKNGADFDDIARFTFDDPRLANFGGDLGWVDWDQLEYDLAMAAFHQEINTFSQPIQSSHGFHILKVVDWKKEIFVTDDDYRQHREKHTHLLKNKIGDKIAYDYVQQMMNGLDIQVRTRELELVGNELKQLFNQYPPDSIRMNTKQLLDEEIKSIETRLWDIRNRPLFLINGESFSVGQFISNLPYLPGSIVRKSYKTALDYSIRDFQLMKEAKKMKLDKKSKMVRVKEKLFADYLLQMMLRKKIIDAIEITEDELKQKYEDLTSAKNPTKPYAEFRAELTRILLQDKKATAVPNYIKKLRDGLTIEKNTELIHAYYDSIKVM